MRKTILHIDSSPRMGDSVTRRLTAKLVEQLSSIHETTIIRKDLAEGVHLVNGLTLAGYFTSPETHSEDVKKAVSFSDIAVQELISSDILVIGIPIWNFTIPASLKAWVDLIVRSDITFKVDKTGYLGLLPVGKKAYLVLASGGIPIGSEYDHASSYMKNLLGFLGVFDVEIIAADCLTMPIGAENLKKAEATIESIVK